MSSASDFVIENGVLKEYVGPGGEVVIPEGVTSIGPEAFNNRFDNCPNLTSVTIPEGVTSIGNDAFYNCYNLTNVTLPRSLTTIGNAAFSWCKSLTSVTIPDSVTSIGDYAFHGCRKLADAAGFVIVKGVLYDYNGPGGGVTIPDSVTSIGTSAFSGCESLASVEIPESVTSIGGSAFHGCSGLTSVTIPESMTSIGDYAFSGCNRLTSVTIPGSVKMIGKDAFSVLTSFVIEDISLLPALSRPKTAIGFAERGGNRETMGFASYSKYIKSNAAKLVEQAMKHPALLKLMCEEKLITPKNVEFYVDTAQKSGDPELIAMMLDYQANKVSAKQKEAVAKRKEKEQDTVIDRMVSRQGKEGIEGLNIAVTGELETFSNRSELKAFLMENGAKLASSLTAKVDYLIMNHPGSDSKKTQKAKELGIEVITERRFNDLVGRAFVIRETVLTKYCGTGGDVAIPEGVTSIDKFAFSGCSDLTGVTIPEGVTSIGESAFWGCSGLTSVTIPESVTCIGWEPFWGCKNLTIHTPVGSFAEQYAKENNIPFVAE